MSYPIRSLEERFWRKVIKAGPNDCWLWKGKKHNQGYGILSASKTNPDILSHRLAWIIIKGELGDKDCVLHNCPNGDNRLCCNPAHLFIGTRTDNAKDRDNKGRTAKGEQHGRRKLTELQVLAILEECKDGLGFNKAKTIAQKYKVGWRHIYSLYSKSAWSYIHQNQGPEPIAARIK